MPSFCSRPTAWIPGLLVLLLSGAIAGCNPQSANAPTPSPTTTASASPDPASPDDTGTGTQGWTDVVPGETTGDLTFTADAALSLGDTVLLPTVPVSYDSNNTPTNAARLTVSPPSPSGRYSIVKACEEAAPGQGLCWSVYKVDRQQESAQKVTVGKYGGRDWVQWSPDERYAVFLEATDGAFWFIALDLESGEAMMTDELPAEANLDGFVWTGDRTFEAPLADGSTFQGDITTLFPPG